MDQSIIIDETRLWISRIVIGLNLCPFAQRVFDADKIRFVVSDAHDEASLLKDLTDELKTLAAAPISSIETTLLIHPQALTDFLEYNDFLDVGEERIEELGLTGVIQLASFHPGYQFADADPDAVEHYTNRSPYPMLHLLREESIDAIANDPDRLLEIPEHNTETLRALGREKILQLLCEIARSQPRG